VVVRITICCSLSLVALNFLCFHSIFTFFHPYRQVEKDIEERLRQKYALIDRTDPSAIQAAQQVHSRLIFNSLTWFTIKLTINTLKTKKKHFFILKRMI